MIRQAYNESGCWNLQPLHSDAFTILCNIHIFPI